MKPDFHKQFPSVQKGEQELLKKFYELFLSTIYMMLKTFQM